MRTGNRDSLRVTLQAHPVDAIVFESPCNLFERCLLRKSEEKQQREIHDRILPMEPITFVSRELFVYAFTLGGDH